MSVVESVVGWFEEEEEEVEMKGSCPLVKRGHALMVECSSRMRVVEEE